MSRSELLQLARSTSGVSENGVIVTARTGVIAAGAAASSVFWAYQPDYPSTVLDTEPCVLERLRLQWTCITAFGTPVTAGRELALCGLEVMPSSGGSNHSVVRKQNIFGEGLGGTTVVSNTAALAIGTPPDLNRIFGRVSLAGHGASGASLIKEWRWDTGSAQMLQVLRASPVGVICTTAMDAAGTFELVIEAEYQCVPEGWPVPA